MEDQGWLLKKTDRLHETIIMLIVTICKSISEADLCYLTTLMMTSPQMTDLH